MITMMAINLSLGCSSLNRKANISTNASVEDLHMAKEELRLKQRAGVLDNYKRHSL
jgi:hypothetical protein